MSNKPYSYTNRQGKTVYFRAVPTKKGGIRYYLTHKSDAEGLISEIPKGFEVVELPWDGQVVLRKKVPVYTTEDEKAIVQEAMEKYSPVKDFIVTAERGGIAISISQFSHFYEAAYLTHEQAKKIYGNSLHKWKKYDWIMTFELLNKKTRKFQVIRKAEVEYDAVPIDEGTNLKELAKKYCYHIGRESLLEFWIPGEDW